MTKEEWYKQLFEHLEASKFRSSFHLKKKDIDYINEKGLDVIRQHAQDYIAKREAPAVIPNDGKQTPTRDARCPVDIGFAPTEAERRPSGVYCAACNRNMLSGVYQEMA